MYIKNCSLKVIQTVTYCIRPSIRSKIIQIKPQSGGNMANYSMQTVNSRSDKYSRWVRGVRLNTKKKIVAKLRCQYSRRLITPDINLDSTPSKRPNSADLKIPLGTARS